MNTELPSIRDFLAAHHPFDQLPEQVLDLLSEQLEERHFPGGKAVLVPDEPNDCLYIVRRGAVELHDLDGRLLARLGEGDVFGQRALLGDGTADVEARTIEETLLYCLPAAQFHQLCGDYPQFQYFFAPVGAGRLRGALQTQGQSDGTGINLMTVPIADLVSRAPVTQPCGASIQEAAQTMRREGVSSLMVVEDGKLKGLITDRDLRNRVIAEGLAYDRPLAEIMTASPVTIEVHGFAYEALLAMARSNYHHLPVMDGERVVGMITDTDLMRRYSTSPLYLLGEIYRCRDLDCLVRTSRQIAPLLRSLVEGGSSAQSIGYIISSIGEAITCRLLALFEERQGSPPVPYAWLSGGSLGRREQTAHSDQDNCLLLADAYHKESHGAYFEALSEFLCDGLDACGYFYCPGEIMATTPRWRQPLKVWKGYFDNWIDQPQPKALLNATIFFDLRCLYGDAALFKELQTYFLNKARDNQIFLAFMASNALTHQPPLGFFRNFVLIKGGEHDRTLDLKHSGVVPIVDLARVYALAGAIEAVNTRDRIEAAERQGILSQKMAADLRDALEFIGMVRLRHQAHQIQEGKAPDNFMSPKDLSHFERSHLKDAFSVIGTLQSSLTQRYQTARFG